MNLCRDRFKWYTGKVSDRFGGPPRPSIVPLRTKLTHTGVSELARECGYSVASVSKKLTQGKTPDQIREDARRAGMKPVKLTAKDIGRRTVQAMIEGAIDGPPDAPNGNGTGSGTAALGAQENFYQAQAREKRVVANLKELEYRQRSGELVPAEQLNQWFAGCIIKARDILMNLGPQLRDRVAQETDPIVCEEMITFEIRRALGELELYGVGKRERDAMAEAELNAPDPVQIQAPTVQTPASGSNSKPSKPSKPAKSKSQPTRR